MCPASADGSGRAGIATYVFQPVQILVTFPASLAVERLFLLHAQRSGVGSASFGVDDGKGSVAVFVQLLRLVTMCLVVSGEKKKKQQS